MLQVTSRFAVVVVSLSVGIACHGQQKHGDVVGVENRCGSALEVSVGDTEPVESWSPVAAGTWEKVSTVDSDAPFLFWFRAEGDSSTPKPVQLEAADVVRSVGGPLDLLIVVEGGQCPV